MKLSLLLLSSTLAGAAELPQEFIRAIHQTESSGRLGAIVGDNGKAFGPLQIHRVCWRDSRVKGIYPQDCADLAYSIKVMTAYLNRYCPDAVKTKDFETMARVWNGGPNGFKKNSTRIYWTKVKTNLK